VLATLSGVVSTTIGPIRLCAAEKREESNE